MRIAEFRADNVHGYMPLHIEFFPNLTFITGLNGSGKTTALRLLMGLLTPQIEELASIQFNTCSVRVIGDQQETIIKADKTSGALKLSLTGNSHPLIISDQDLQTIVESRREEGRPAAYARIAQHDVYRSIKDISTPMFLSLDRRFYYTDPDIDPLDQRRRDLLVHKRAAYQAARMPPTKEGLRREHAAAGLSDVNFLIADRLSEIRAAQEQMDKRLRDQFLLGAFQYTHVDIDNIGTLPGGRPSRSELEEYRTRQAKFERAADGLRIPLSEVKSALDVFFERMLRVVDDIEDSDRNVELGDGAVGKSLIEWMVNSPQANRIFDHLKLLEDYSVERAKLRDPIERFLVLVNSFLKQTGKLVEVSDRGALVVTIQGGEKRPIFALSSGERQIVVMLAHLSLNPRLTDSGVFIVDEPELSLHISWQSSFVRAVREANPNVQLILATHSPAIILDEDDHCRSLS